MTEKWEWVLKMCFGFLLLIAVLILAVIVARQSAAQQAIDNTDLQQILTLFAVLAGGFSQWAFTHRDGPPPPPQP